MMLPVALVSVLAGPPATVAAPPPTVAPVEAAPAPAQLAPAPAPSELAPAPAPVESSPAPAEAITAEPAPAPPPTAEPIIGEEWSTEPAAPVVVMTPAPTPAPLTLSPPAPTWQAVHATGYVPPSPERVRQTMRQHRRGAFGALAIGGLGMAATLGLQSLRVRTLQRCAVQGPRVTVDDCGNEALDFAFSRYGVIGMGMLVVGSTGAGVMLGNAAATRDVQLHGGNARRRGGLKVLGVAIVGIATGWMIGANLQLARHEAQCDLDANCLLRYRPLRMAANDGAALGVAAGAGMVGYALGYERQGKALMRLRAAPSLGARHGGVSVAIEF